MYAQWQPDIAVEKASNMRIYSSDFSDVNIAGVIKVFSGINSNLYFYVSSYRRY